jgi:DNA-binding transcriptional MerR regulator
VEGFSTGQVQRLTGIPQPRLNYWVATGFLQPSLHSPRGKGKRRRYTFADLVAARVARELREAGIPLQAIRKAVKRLQAKGYSYPLADCYLIGDPLGRKDVLFKDGDTVLSCLREPGQQLLFALVIDLSRICDEMHQAATRLQKAAAKAKACAG